jgi:hypothetical protein
MVAHGKDDAEGGGDVGPSSRRSLESGGGSRRMGGIDVLGCRSVNCFEKQQLQGEGTYGQVWPDQWSFMLV